MRGPARSGSAAACRQRTRGGGLFAVMARGPMRGLRSVPVHRRLLPNLAQLAAKHGSNAAWTGPADECGPTDRR